MKCIKLLLYTVLAISIMPLAVSTVSAQDLNAGRAKVEAACQTCHGVDGVATTAMVPNLSGQQKEYMVVQLEAFRSGQRQHPQMTIIAQMLNDDDIENVSGWYANIKISVEAPE